MTRLKSMLKTVHGYIRFRCGAMEYEHRLIARIAWGPRVKFPTELEVHHMDGKRSHNCRPNLLILPDVLHNAKSNRKGKRNEKKSNDYRNDSSFLDSCL